VETEEDWLDADLPDAGSLYLQGLCGTSPANEAYGWSALSAWGFLQEIPFVVIAMRDADGERVGDSIYAYFSDIAQLGTCTNYTQYVQLEASQISNEWLY
jgi:hypothetical protein